MSNYNGTLIGIVYVLKIREEFELKRDREKHAQLLKKKSRFPQLV